MLPLPPRAGVANGYFVARKDAKPLLILHVEDDENDAILFQRACERAGLPAEVRRVEAADIAKAYLLGKAFIPTESSIRCHKSWCWT